MSGIPHDRYEAKSRGAKWVESRIPAITLIYDTLMIPTPRNLNWMWIWGIVLAFCLALQIVTGIVLAMHYTPHVDLAFASVEHIMRDVNAGHMLRYLHANGASLFFIAVYAHIFRGLYYGSYKAPREMIWILGVLIFLLMMATGFMGYVLPWGQMSFWGATVITGFFTAIPLVGEWIQQLLLGGFAVDNATLNRFFSLHYLLPFVIAGVVILKIWSLHIPGSNNPAGIDVKGPADTLPFHPYFTVKDLFGAGVYLIVFSIFLFFLPNFLGHPDNYIPANPISTPAHIVPEWYFWPFYAILRAFTFNFLWIDAKLWGVIAMFASIALLFFLPWLDSAKVRSSRYRPLAKQFFWIFVVVCLLLGWLGGKPAEGVYIIAARILTFCYFAYFLLVLPILSRVEKTRPVPNSIADDVLAKSGRGAAKSVASVAVALGLAGAMLAGGLSDASAAEGAPPPPAVKWSFSGPFGTFDRGQLQRGYKVYKEVCSACHSLDYLSFRNLSEAGGPGFSAAQAAQVAKEYKIKDGPNDSGEMFERPGRLADKFPSPFPNEQAARASNGGAYPPDLSLIAKARSYPRGFPQFIFDLFTQYQEQGPDYLHALLTGYKDNPPADFTLPEGSFYNTYFPGHAIKMPKPISDDQVTYDDGSPQTVEQYSRDVTAFLMWAAEPHMEARKRLGIQVMIFLIVLAGLLYFTKRKVWANAH